jgi:hypothetical protein
VTECIHGLEGCATCAGVDDGVNHRMGRGAGREVPWAPRDVSVAMDRGLSSADAAAVLGRTVSSVSSYRVNVLRMTGYPGWTRRVR